MTEVYLVISTRILHDQALLASGARASLSPVMSEWLRAAAHNIITPAARPEPRVALSDDCYH
jgi:hypothetical protein